MKLKITRTTAVAYFLKDEDSGDKFRVNLGYPTEIHVNDGKTGIYVVDAQGYVFDFKGREWVADMGTYFYPAAGEDATAMVDKVIKAVLAKKN